MAPLKRFESQRYVGTRDDMKVYDTQDAGQADALAARAATEDLFGRNLLQSFAPDELREARNRGFKPIR